MMRDLEGKVAIVTGGGGGIGAATALRLAQAGAAVAVADIVADAAAKVADRLTADGLKAQAFTVDISEEDQVRAFVAEVISTFRRIDILHNNAVNSDPAVWGKDLLLAEMDVEVWDRIFAVNIRGAMLMIKHVAPQIARQGDGGAIINMSSVAAVVGQADRLVGYGSTKGAINSLTYYAAAQFGAHNIRCNAVMPGAVLTDMLRTFYSPEDIRALESITMLNRASEPEDIANLVHFLAGDKARQITGQVIRIDGGMK